MAQQIRKRNTLREVEEEVRKDSEQLRLERGAGRNTSISSGCGLYCTVC